MIEIGTIAIKNQKSIFDSRKKILHLAQALKFNSINAARLASVSSELCRVLVKRGIPLFIKVNLDRRKKSAALVIHFISKRTNFFLPVSRLREVFDGLKISKTKGDIERIEVLKFLPESGFRFSPEFVCREKEELEKPTKEELLHQLETLVRERTKKLFETNKRLEKEIADRKIIEKQRQELYERLEESYRKLKQQTSLLIQTEKMSAVGTMVAGVAHELNNPMMGMQHFVHYCLRHTSEDNKIYPVLKDIKHETKRCIDIVQNLLSFSRLEKEGEEAYQKENCAVVLDRVLKLLSYRFKKKNVVLSQKIDDDVPAVWMKVNNIQQVFLNVVNNALDALEESTKREIRIEVHRKGEFVQVIVADSGCGIKQENIKRIFDPFFTTKPVGKGTGLGLSVSQSIIKEHGGDIICESKVGKGTVIKIFLPIERRKEWKDSSHVHR